MKKRQLLMSLAAFLSLLLTGCLSDDNEIVCIEDFEGELKENETELVGQWMLSGIVSEKEVDLTDDDADNPIKDIFVQYTDCQNDRIYTFANNRRYTFIRGGNDTLACKNKSESDGTWRLSGKTLSFVTECNIRNMNIVLNREESFFSVSDDFEIKDVQGKVIRSEVTFTYTMK
ncbi:DUF5004 domain-containing protein [Maribacter sp. 2210JD10-5]|uniref:DUF5004 domain-containing protein n=1 Tax=Maribacter sp. 2210JD10-5 TaxID=3386272 RepID=UPI0039BCCAAE